MNNISNVYVFKDSKLYKKDTKNTTETPWMVYDPSSRLWNFDNIRHAEFRAADYISMERACVFKKTIEEKFDNKVDKPASFFAGEYIYFKASKNLYKVRNPRLDSDLYLGNDNWKENASRLTLVGVQNNYVTKEDAAEIMKSIDMRNVETKSKASLEPMEDEGDCDKYIGRCFVYGEDKLLKVDSYQGGKFNRYHCSKYTGDNLWKHEGFFSEGSISHRLIAEDKVKEVMEAMDIKLNSTKNGLDIIDPRDTEENKEPLQDASSIDSKLEKNETINNTCNKIEEECKDENVDVTDNKLELNISYYNGSDSSSIKPGSYLKEDDKVYIVDKIGDTTVFAFKLIPGRHGMIYEEDNGFEYSVRIFKKAYAPSLLIPKEEADKYMNGTSNEIKPGPLAKKSLAKAPLFIKIPAAISEGTVLKLNGNMYTWKVVEIIRSMGKRTEAMVAVAISDLFREYKSEAVAHRNLIEAILDKMHEEYIVLEAISNLRDPEEDIKELCIANRYFSKQELEDRIAEIYHS